MRKFLTALAVASAALPLQAATFTVVTTADIAQGGATPNFTYELTAAAMSPPFDIELAVGDTFDFTIRFQPGQTLTLSNPTTFWAFAFTDVATQVEGTGQLTLLDGQGQPLLASFMKTSVDGDVHFGQSFHPEDFASLPSVVTIGGLHYVGTVEGYLTNDVTSRHYTEPRLALSADSVVSSVPEPSQGWLLLAGLASTGLLLKRRRLR